MSRGLFMAMAAFLMASGISLGAVGAHMLEQRLAEKALAIYEKAVLYQNLNALGLLVLATALPLHSRLSNYALIGIVLGVLLFSGSLYLYVLLDKKIFAMITPFGGLMMILSWLLASYVFFSSNGNSPKAL